MKNYLYIRFTQGFHRNKQRASKTNGSTNNNKKYIEKKRKKKERRRYPNASSGFLTGFKKLGNVTAHLSYLNLSPVPQQLYPRNRQFQKCFTVFSSFNFQIYIYMNKKFMKSIRKERYIIIIIITIKRERERERERQTIWQL